MAESQPVAGVSLRALLAYFLRLGALGFGGPIALVGYMQRDLVETRGWFTKEEYDEGLALAQLVRPLDSHKQSPGRQNASTRERQDRPPRA